MIPARDDGQSLDRPLIYRALAPQNWIRLELDPASSIADSTKANCEFQIEEGEEKIRITCHTFPILEGKRIPPQAQIARWKRQLENLDQLSVHVTPNSHGGFSGLFFEGEGNQVKVLGWSMQLGEVYLRQLGLEKEKRADYTIKAVGPPSMIEKHRHEIIQFANSFELIDELPHD